MTSLDQAKGCFIFYIALLNRRQKTVHPRAGGVHNAFGFNGSDGLTVTDFGPILTVFTFYGAHFRSRKNVGPLLGRVHGIERHQSRILYPAI